MIALKWVYLTVTIVALLINLLVFGLYWRRREEAPTGRFARLFAPWRFSPQDLGGFSWYRLVLASLLLLFVELMVIRWISSEIRIFAYLKNFVLIACFLGFGLGCYLCRRSIQLIAVMLPLLFMALLVKTDTPWMRAFIEWLPTSFGRASDVDIWGVPVLPNSFETYVHMGAATLFTALLFAMISAVFIPMGQLVGWYLENATRGILGYSLNVLASLGGILLYTLLAFWSQPPPTWFLVAGLLAGLLLLPRRIPAITALVVFALIAVISGRPEGAASQIYWSPYQKLMLFPQHDEDGELIRYHLLTNNVWYQQILDLTPEFAEEHPELFEELPLEYNPYNLPYHFSPEPESALILGAGMGNDVAAALRGGAEKVVAVEIDPTIERLGRELHFERPYTSPRVETVLDDARSYLQKAVKTDQRFDLIVFSLLDSHTNSSHFSNIRIDNYVYTIEALKTARNLLKPDGVFIIKFATMTPWISSRLNGLMREAFEREPVLLQDTMPIEQTTGGRFFLIGPEEVVNRVVNDPEFSQYVSQLDPDMHEPVKITTDNWPYFYQRAPGLPTTVLLISVVLVVLAWLEIRLIGTGLTKVRWHFFFLGAGFMLLETQIISKMALLFGTTWLVNSIVIAMILLLIVVANGVVALWPRFPVKVAYAGIFLALLLVYVLPVHWLFFDSALLKGLVSATIFCLPVFFASVIFIQSYAKAGFMGEALGSNLFGAMVGGLLESVSLWTGMRFLVVLATLLYLGSLLALRRGRFARGA